LGMSDTTWLLIVFALGAASIGAAGAIYVWVKKQKPGSDRAQEIGGFIRRSARTYLRKLYLSLAVVAAGAALVLAAALGLDWPRLGWPEKVSSSTHPGGSGCRRPSWSAPCLPRWPATWA